MNTMTTREAFETEAKKHGFILDRLDKSGEYVQLITEQAWKAAKATCPAWHDAPTVPGLWVCLRDSRHKSYRVRDIEVQVTIPEDGDRWYGPIPEDRQ